MNKKWHCFFSFLFLCGVIDLVPTNEKRKIAMYNGGFDVSHYWVGSRVLDEGRF